MAQPFLGSLSVFLDGAVSLSHPDSCSRAPQAVASKQTYCSQFWRLGAQHQGPVWSTLPGQTALCLTWGKKQGSSVGSFL